MQQENRRKNKLIKGAFDTVKWLVLLFGILLAADIAIQLLELDNYLIKECFSMVKYAASTILGFLFASKQNT